MADGDHGLLVERPDRLLRDRVTDAVREAITRGDLEPGRRLTERELGELTGVSRTSLREALRSLQAEGLVERSGARGLQVAVLTPAVVSELYDVRAPLEAAAVELCVRNASDDQIAALRAAMALPGSGELDDQLAATRKFYDLLLDTAGNSILQQMFGSIEARIHALRRVSLRIGGRGEASHRELLEIVDLIEQRNGPAAAEAAHAHVLAAKAAALAALGREAA
ncbi:GntR family transcriptional regulator [Nocardia sp. NPDC050630]|uniref:GntR family transcriptional regulator n=1 Tax=Nocardia sp. NPDC050630 TaxID=3364321 RepID=UPI0037877295